MGSLHDTQRDQSWIDVDCLTYDAFPESAVGSMACLIYRRSGLRLEFCERPDNIESDPSVLSRNEQVGFRRIWPFSETVTQRWRSVGCDGGSGRESGHVIFGHPIAQGIAGDFEKTAGFGYIPA